MNSPLRNHTAQTTLILLAVGLATAPPSIGADHVAPSTRPTAPQPAAPSPTPDSRALAGTASCRKCHEHFYQLWSTSHHGLAMQRYSPEFAARNLTPQNHAIKLGDTTFTPNIQPGQGWITAAGPDGEHRLPIEFALGGKNVYYFLTPAQRGRWQTLPIAYDVREKTWFDTASSAMRHFPRAGATDAPLDWSDRAYTFNSSCYGCHVSQLATTYDLATDTYATQWTEPGINCETCHGPAADHVRVCTDAPENKPPKDLEITVVTQSRGFSPERVNDACAVCHAKVIRLTGSFHSGQRFFDNFDLATLEDPDFYPDGRDLGENYTYTTWLLSPCVKPGQLDCLHCHTSSGRFRFADQPNDACLPCHADRVANPTTHTHHRPDSKGSVCISCHMPMTDFARMRRSDHSMLPPTPATTIAYGSPNACNLCHHDHDADWADARVREWHDDDYQRPILERAALVDGARRQDWSRLDDMLRYISSPQRDAVFASSLLRLLAQCDNDGKWPAILRALDDASPLVRSAALRALGRHVTPESLPPMIQATRDDYRLVRLRAAMALATVPRSWLTQAQKESLADASKELVASLTNWPDDPTQHYNLGNYYLARGNYNRAIACYNNAATLAPTDIAPLVNAALAHHAAGDMTAAEQSLRRALTIAPNSAEANLNLGMLLAETDRNDEALSAFQRAASAEPQSAPAAYNLAVLLATRDTKESLAWSRKAYELSPGNPKYAYTYAFYLHETNELQKAINVLTPLTRANRADERTYAFLAELYLEISNRPAAIATYRSAAADPQLSDQTRAAFQRHAQLLQSQP